MPAASPSGRPTHVDLNANAAPAPAISDRERLESLRSIIQHKNGWQSVTIEVIALDWLMNLVDETLAERENSQQ